VQSVYQQLHNYPVGASGADRAESAKGNKYNITPVRREFLSDLRAVIALRGNDDLADRVRRGLAGEYAAGRYGVPFLGDNAFLIDRLEELTDPGPVRWYKRITAGSGGVRDRATRLTILIDRADLSRTTSALFAPGDPSADPPADAWTAIEPPAPPAVPIVVRKSRGRQK
jgi:CRISPR-associated protein Cas5t